MLVLLANHLQLIGRLNDGLAYLNWANEVVERLPFTPKEGLDEFFKRYDIAELDAYDDLGTIRQGENAALRVIERRAKGWVPANIKLSK